MNENIIKEDNSIILNTTSDEMKSLSNDELLKLYQDIEGFIKYLDEEIKKTDVGDENA